VDQFAAMLGDCLFHRAPWPAHWCGDPNAAKILLSVSVSNLTQMRDYALIHSLLVPLHLRPWLERPRNPINPFKGDPWAAVRELIDPRTRRLLFWFMGWLTVSNMPIDLWPDPVAGHMASSLIFTVGELTQPTRYAAIAMNILKDAVLRREWQRIDWERHGQIVWGKDPSLWKEPIRPRVPH
jgi:hypothetical protein